MKSLPATLVFLTSSVLMFTACGGSDEEKALAQVKKPIGVGSTNKANIELEEAVKDKLNGDEQLKAAKLNISADVTRNEVTLSGTVPSEALKKKAIELAKSAHAGVIVTDRISVKPSASSTVGRSALV